MRKLITAMVSAATALFIGASYAADDGQISGTSFEDLESGDKSVNDLISYTDNGGNASAGNLHWFAMNITTEAAADEIIGVVTNYADAIPTVTRPAQWEGTITADNQYLALDTSIPIYRTINASNEKTTLEALTGTEIASGIYLDTLIKFTAADPTDPLELETGDKIAIAYVEESEDGDGDGVAMTNFVIRAGYVNGSQVEEKNYVMNAIEGFDKADWKDAWHRLTVRTIANVGNATAPVGFVVYVDGEALTYSTTDPAGDDAYVASLNSTVKTYLYNDTAHALIPSAMSSSDEGYDTLSAVAFKGNGSVDDISFTTTQPSFINEGTTVTIAWDAGVASVVVNDGTSDIASFSTADLEGVTSTNLLLNTGVEALTITATYDSANGYVAGTWTSSVKDSISGNTWAVSAGAQLNIVSMKPLFEVGGVGYDDFSTALAAAVAAGTSDAPATIKLMADVDGSIAFDEGYIILDLAGKTITGDDSQFGAIVNNGAALQIINSTDDVGVVIPYDEYLAVMIAGGTTSISGGKFAGTIDWDSEEGELVLTGGAFINDSEDAVFYRADYVDTTVYDITGPDADGYFTVSEKGGEEPDVTYVASIGDNQYETFAEAFNAAESGNTIKLLADVTLESTFVVEKTITLDMGGKTVTATGFVWANNPAVFWVKNGGNLTLANGTLSTNVEGIRLGVKKSTNESEKGTATIASDAVITTSDIGVMLYGGSTLTSSGTIESSSKDYAAIQGNGLDTLESTINITGGSVTSTGNHAIFHPQVGTLTISGGEISGVTGIEMRAGTLNMSAGSVVATGVYSAPVANSSGSTGTGAAIILSQYGTTTAMTADISGGSITAENGKTLVVANTTAKDAATITATIAAAATFDGEKAAVLIDTLKLEGNATDGYSVVALNTYALTIPQVTGATATVTVGGETVSDLTAIAEGTVVTVTWTAAEGYTITAGAIEEITMIENKTAASPTVALNTYALTIPQVTGATATVTVDEETITDYTAIAHGTVVTVTWTAAEGYTITAGATEEITMIENKTAASPTVAAIGGDYPTYIDPANADAKAKYDAWSAAYSVTDTGSAYVEAFLLNVAPADVEEAKAAFKITAFSIDASGNVTYTTTTEYTTGKAYNGKVTIKRYSDVQCTTESDTGTFFKAVLQ